VVGTACEVIAAGEAVKKGSEKITFSTTKVDQVERGEDFRMLFRYGIEFRDYAVSVKKKLGEGDKVRLYKRMFKPGYSLDYIAFVDFDTWECHFYFYPQLKQLWLDKRGRHIQGDPDDPDDVYCYVSSTEFVEHKF
jgi:hypothetical protein